METRQPEKNTALFWIFAIAGAAGAMLCYEFDFFFALLFLPACWSAAAFHGKNGAGILAALSVATLLYGILYLGYDFLFAFRILFLILPASAILFLFHKYKIGNTLAALTIAPAIAVGLFVIFCGNAILNGEEVYSEARLYFYAVLDPAFKLIPTSRLPFTLEELIESLPLFYPGFVYAFGAFYALVNTVLLQIFNGRKKQMPLVPARSPAFWSVPRRYILGCFILVMLSLVLDLSGVSFGSSLMLVGYLMLTLPLGVAGASAVYMLLTVRKNTSGRRVLAIAVIVILTLTGIGGYIFPVLGFFKSSPFRRLAPKHDSDNKDDSE